MPKVESSIPQKIYPYTSNGLDIQAVGNGQWRGDCFTCGKEKLYVDEESGQYNCKVCSASGNAYTFLRWLIDSGQFTSEQLQALSANRQFLNPASLQHWGITKSPITNDWILPGWSADGKLCQVYRYRAMDVGMALLATGGLSHGLFGVDAYDAKKPDVYLCEGPWDAVALWELLRSAKRQDGDKLAQTGSEAASLYADANVLAVPGCGVFREAWLPLFDGKRVFLCYDNDHPRKVGNNGRPPMDGAGWLGMKKVTEWLAKSEQPPVEIHYLNWSGSDTTYNPKLKSGYDVRDFLTQKGGLQDRLPLLSKLLRKMSAIPPDWIKGRSNIAVKAGGTEIECLPCSNWKKLIDAWRKAMEWTKELDKALSVMLASIVSVETSGSQLWIKVISPPSTGKSVLCEALSVNKKYTKAASVVRGFHSGYRESNDAAEDNSLINQLRNKTLISKDGDTILQSPNREQVLAEARDIYDRVSRTHYRNKASKDYEGVNMTWILCGTSSLRILDQSELGERFLDCVIVDAIDPKQEEAIGWHIINRNIRAAKLGTEASNKHGDSPEMLLAKQLTGGYITYLKKNIEESLAQVETTKKAGKAIIDLGMLVANMRARPSKTQDEDTQREFAPRLIDQLHRLSQCLTVVLGKKETDAEVLRRVKAVALDTARGKVMRICGLLYKGNTTKNRTHEGLFLGSVATSLGVEEDSLGVLMKFLKRIGVVDSEIPKGQSRYRWKLSPYLKELWKRVIDVKEDKVDAKTR